MNNNDRGFGTDEVAVAKGFNLSEMLNHKTMWKINRWLSEADFKNSNPYSTSEFEGNVLTNAGINLLWTIGCGGAGTAWSAANAAIAVGTNATAALAADTTLGTETARAGMDSPKPVYGSSQQAVFQATFTGLVANVHWQEFGVLNNVTSGGTLLNHKISDQGTKTSGQIWQVSCTITLS